MAIYLEKKKKKTLASKTLTMICDRLVNEIIKEAEILNFGDKKIIRRGKKIN